MQRLDTLFSILPVCSRLAFTVMLFVKNDPGGDTLDALNSAEDVYIHSLC